MNCEINSQFYKYRHKWQIFWLFFWIDPRLSMAGMIHPQISITTPKYTLNSLRRCNGYTSVDPGIRYGFNI